MSTLSNFNIQLNEILLEDTKKYKAAVGIVQDKRKWLLGLSTATDDRHNTWCFAGGRIRDGEKPTTAAVREVGEETGIKCKAVGKPFTMSGKPDVCFIHCTVTGSRQKLVPNSEFSVLGFFTRSELKSLKLYHNVLKLLDKI